MGTYIGLAYGPALGPQVDPKFTLGAGVGFTCEPNVRPGGLNVRSIRILEIFLLQRVSLSLVGSLGTYIGLAYDPNVGPQVDPNRIRSTWGPNMDSHASPMWAPGSRISHISGILKRIRYFK